MRGNTFSSLIFKYPQN